MAGHVTLTGRKQRQKAAVPLTFSFSIWEATPQDDVTHTRVWSSHFGKCLYRLPPRYIFVVILNPAKLIMNISHHR